MFYLHLKLREKSQSDMYCGTEGVLITASVVFGTYAQDISGVCFLLKPGLLGL